jgi:CcmD family protein
MTQELVFLFIGYGVIWLLLFAYLVYVTGRIRSVGDDVQEIREGMAIDAPHGGTGAAGG